MPICSAAWIFFTGTKFRKLPNSPSTAARRMWYDTVGHDDPIAIRSAWEAFGPDRLVYGSDYPYQLDEVYTHSVQYIRDLRNLRKMMSTLFSRRARRCFRI